LDYDVVVVGGRTAGCAVANTHLTVAAVAERISARMSQR